MRFAKNSPSGKVPAHNLGFAAAVVDIDVADDGTAIALDANSNVYDFTFPSTWTVDSAAPGYVSQVCTADGGAFTALTNPQAGVMQLWQAAPGWGELSTPDAPSYASGAASASPGNSYAAWYLDSNSVINYQDANFNWQTLSFSQGTAPYASLGVGGYGTDDPNGGNVVVAIDANNYIVAEATGGGNVPTMGKQQALSVDIGSDGTLMCVDFATNALLAYDASSQNPWYVYDDSVKYSQVAVGSGSWIFALDTDGNVYMIAGGPTVTTSAGQRVSTPEVPARPRPEWDTESVWNVAQSTHLWIVLKAATLANSAPGGYQAPGAAICTLVGPTMQQSDPTPFGLNLRQGLYDADFLAAYNNPVPVIGTPTYASHFYDYRDGENWRGQSAPTALTNGRQFFNESVSRYAAGDMDAAGYNLGLALHYATDLTQPMHSYSYTYLSSKPLGFHTDFEAQAINAQANVVPPTTFASDILDTNPEQVDVFYTTVANTFGPVCTQLTESAIYSGWQKWKIGLGNSAWQDAVNNLLQNPAPPLPGSILQTAVLYTAQLLVYYAQMIGQSGGTTRPE